jgi:transposase
VVDGTALWFGAAGFDVLDVVDDGVELVIDVETSPALVGCSGCGTRAVPKDRRWVTLRDVPAGRRFVRVRWRKRIWRCPEPDCDVNTWTERAELADPRRVLTTRAAEWATDRVAAIDGTPASIARNFGLSWSTVWSAIERIGTSRVQTPAEMGPATMVGFDETVMSPASRRRRRRFVTVVVDVGSGRLLDVFEGRDAQHLRAWMARMPTSWLSMIKVVSVDPHEGYRGAVLNTDRATGRPSPLAGVAIVVDPFHIVRLANDALTRCRHRVQQETLEHRGWKGDPLYDVRKLLLLGAERVDDAGWVRIHAALDAGDPNGEVRDDPEQAAARLDAAIAWCTEAESGPELRRLAKMLRRWMTQILNHHRTGASNGPVEAMNLLIKQVKRSGRGFRSFANYRLRILLAGGRRQRETQSVTSIRTRRPRLVA